MKLRNYFLLSIVVGAAVACSSNEDIPEEHVFTPNATLSLATGVYGDGRTKAVGIDVTEEEKKKIKSIHWMCLSFPVREMMLCIRLNAELMKLPLSPI